MTEDNARPLGEWLRQRREELEISLEQAETDTRIRHYYLEALESEDFEALPDQVVSRGFLRNYAAYLELDPQEAVARYARLVAPPEPEPLPVAESSPFASGPFRPVPLHEMRRQGSRRWLFVVLLAILVVALSLLTWWGYPYASEWLAQRWSAPEPAPTQRTVKLPTATHTATVTVAAIETSAPATTVPTETTPTLEPTLTPTFTPQPSPSPSPAIYTGIFLELVFTDTSWIQVTVDGVRQFQGELETGTYRSWYGEERIELRIGNAGAVQLTLNGQKLGALGAPGEVIDRVFEKVGAEVTEATVTPEVTVTLTVEPTLAPATEPATPPPTPETSPTAPVSPTMTVSPTATVSPTSEISPTATVSPTVTVSPTSEISPTATITPTTGP